MSLEKQISFVKKAIESVKSNIPPDPLAGLTNRQRAFVNRYRKETTPERQWLDYLNNMATPEALIQRVGLPSDCTEIQAQEAYHREIESFNTYYLRRKRRISK